MKLIFLGPPGAGKGTLAGLVAKRWVSPDLHGRYLPRRDQARDGAGKAGEEPSWAAATSYRTSSP